MASNLSKAMASGQVFVTINPNFDRQWRDFTLQKNHVYGYSPEFKHNGYTGLFVVYQARKGRIQLYLAKKSNNVYNWKLFDIPMDYGKTADKILEVISSRNGKVTFFEDTEKGKRIAYEKKYDCSGIVETKLTVGEYTPMPRMIIPMGKRGKNATVTMRKTHELKCTGAKEVSSKMQSIRQENVWNAYAIQKKRNTREKDAIGITEYV